MKQLFIIPTYAITLGLFACGSNGTNNSNTKDDGSDSDNDPDVIILTEAERADFREDLDDTWLSVCGVEDAEYEQEEYVFTESGSFSYTYRLYADSNCTILNSTETEYDGTYQIVNQKQLESGMVATEIDLFVNQLDQWAYNSIVLTTTGLYLSNEGSEKPETRSYEFLFTTDLIYSRR